MPTFGKRSKRGSNHWRGSKIGKIVKEVNVNFKKSNPYPVKFSIINDGPVIPHPATAVQIISPASIHRVYKRHG